MIATLTEALAGQVQPGQRLTIALSGGVDSVALLHACLTIQKITPEHFAVDALHVHHGLSPNADAWAEFCREITVDWGVECQVEKVEVERGSSDGLEGAARRARHQAYRQCTADWVVLAHHQDDQAETLLFNLLRGCGLAGAAGMRTRNGKLLRPWLSVSRAEIEGYARLHQLRWIEDESNADLRFSRNFLRRRIFPELKERFPSAGANLTRAAAHFAEAAELLDDLARLDLGERAHDFPLDRTLLASLSEVRARNLLRYLLMRRGIMIPSEARLSEAVRQLREAAADKHPEVRLGDCRLVRRRGEIDLVCCGSSV